MKFAKILLTIAAIQYGVIPVVIDLTNTHVFHSDWPPHARFHMVWLLIVGSSIAVYVTALLWIIGANTKSSLRHAAIIGCLPLFGFFVSAALMQQYGGSLSDLDAPIEVMGLDGNVVSFTVAAVFQIIGTLLIWRHTKPIL
ncbi:MAG: hypothetical protein COA43_04555 [Robiginitomaculum sp.]|nr:MAG: hypothetical protein COA43_04555 [Robiginitomaculum sp.]